jgi:hypothetical protein
MRIVVTLLLMVCVGLGLLVYRQTTALRELSQQIQQLNIKLASISATAALDFQEKCARQAREEFKLYGLDKHTMAGGRALIPKNAFGWPILAGFARVGSFSSPFSNFYFPVPEWPVTG